MCPLVSIRFSLKAHILQSALFDIYDLIFILYILQSPLFNCWYIGHISTDAYYNGYTMFSLEETSYCGSILDRKKWICFSTRKTSLFET